MTKVYGTGVFDYRRHRVAEYPVTDGGPDQPVPERPPESKPGTNLPSSMTLVEIQRDRLTKIADANWSKAASDNEKPPFSAELVKEIYETELLVKEDKTGRMRRTVPLQRVMILEVSQYLENYLWPNFDPEKSSFEHVMSKILMINEKFRENVAAWICFYDRKDTFKAFLERVLCLKESLEDDIVSKKVMRLASLHCWHSLSFGRFQMELCLNPDLIKKWKRIAKKAKEAKKRGESFDMSVMLEVKFLRNLIEEFLEVLDSKVFNQDNDDNNQESKVHGSEQINEASILYCERFMEFLIDLLSQLPTRRYFKPLVADVAVVAKCHLSVLYTHEKGKLFAQLVDLLQYYENFEIDDNLGRQMTDDEVLQSHYDRFQAFQLLSFKKIPKLKTLALANIGSINKRADLSAKTFKKRSRIYSRTPTTKATLLLEGGPDQRIQNNRSQTTQHRRSQTAEVTFVISSYKSQIRSEWNALKEHDVLFLLCIRPSFEPLTADEAGSASVPQKLGLQFVRGCEVIEMRDEEGGLMNDFTGRIKRDEWKPPKGDLRTVTLALDTAQYHMDVTDIAVKGTEDVYGSFNILMRRKPKENNFKAILESIRDLMNETCIVPDWLHDIFLGYGNPSAAQWSNMPDVLEMIDFKDTFLDADHVRECFEEYDVREIVMLFLVVNDLDKEKEKLIVEAYLPPDPGPYPQDQPKQNSVRFTPTQVCAVFFFNVVGAIISPGLTMVVGPPGTGKTDTAVQILNVLYHNCPSQRTLIKLSTTSLKKSWRYQISQGEQELATDLDFSRQGRVNAMLVRRLELLSEVERLARSLQLPEDVGYTCETAGYFWLLHVYSRWEQFLSTCADPQNQTKPNPHLSKTSSRSPNSSPTPQTPRYSPPRHSTTTCAPPRGEDRRDDAALKRKDFLKLGFKYDNLLMEESAQILEIETFIPMLLQRQEDGYARLKRCILIGDHHQLPPVVKNMAFQKYSHMDQSLFTRFVRLGIPYIELNAQGRARPSLAKLYNWRYRDLGDLPFVKENPFFQKGNAGFCYDYQLVDVGEYNGRGESAPSPWFYQNEGEAEYLVSVYIYMRLLGYPANKISILTTYNGQKLLIRDVLNRRCAPYDFIGLPHKVATVDKFQGQQNDFILLSLVRTRFVGHLRDVRRLIVAMSRARLGLYVFCRRALFEQCYELQPTFRILLQRPDSLALNLHEVAPVTDRVVDETGPAHFVTGIDEMEGIVNFRMHQVYQARMMVNQYSDYEETGVANEGNGEHDDDDDDDDDMEAGNGEERMVNEGMEVDNNVDETSRGDKNEDDAQV
ncbi:hypothetical protein LXL04_017004 [Taraxacum kok-saghyz]